MTERRALVIGGGISGLAAAIELLDGPFDAIEIHEAADRVGGKIATSSFAGVPDVDEGADAFLRRVPHGVGFAHRVGLDADALTSPTDASALVWHDGMHPIPGGIVLGLPAEIRPFVTTSLLSWRGKLRAAVEPLLPASDHDDSLGRLVRSRFGDEVHERLVDALVGSIYAADTDRWSLASVPQLAAVARDERSLLIGARRARRRGAAASGPIFAAPRRGIGALVDAAVEHLRSAGVDIRTSATVSRVQGSPGAWHIDGDDRPFAAVVLAGPAAATARVLGDVAPDAAAAIATVDTADVIMVRLSVPDFPERFAGHSGYLVPKPDQRHVTAASFASQKWAHWQPPSGDQILRVSLGRDGLPVEHLDDDDVRRIVVEETGHHLDIDLQPNEMSITRWRGAFPQYRPHHHELVGTATAALPPGLALAGASYHGIGIPACIASGVAAARNVKESTGHADGFLT